MYQIWIPHMKKMGLAEGRRLGIVGFNPADPPLAEGQREVAERLVQELFIRSGPPAAIFTSPKLRCMQTAAPAIRRFVRPFDRKAPIAVALSCLAQTDSGEHNPSHPEANEDGLVYYGERSAPVDWLHWFEQSARMISAVYRAVEAPSGLFVWVFTHRPLVAAARWATQPIPAATADGVPPPPNALDETLLPFCIFEDGPYGWTEIPRR